MKNEIKKGKFYDSKLEDLVNSIMSKFGLTKKDIAEKIGLSVCDFSNKLNGRQIERDF